MQPKTYFIDIDGTILKHLDDFRDTIKADLIEETPQASAKISKWLCQGHTIVITTARPESLRSVTERQLRGLGIAYHHLIMGISAGIRVLVNDYEPGKPTKAKAFNVVRNEEGLRKVD